MIDFDCNISQMSISELEMEMSLYIRWDKWHKKIYNDPSNAMPPEEFEYTERYKDYLKRIIFEYEKRKYDLIMYYYVYSEPVPPNCYITRDRRHIKEYLSPPLQGDDPRYFEMTTAEFKKHCKDLTFTGSNCRCYYAVKRTCQNSWLKLPAYFRTYYIACTPETFLLDLERTDFSYISYYYI